jgi:hypothetical protein
MNTIGVAGIALWLQGSEVVLPSSSNTLILAFLGVLAMAVLLQFFVLLAMAIGARKTHAKVVSLLEDFETRLNPILDTTRVLLDDAAPKVRIITGNLVTASYLVREQAESVSQTMDEFNGRVRYRMAMVDGLIGAGVQAIDRAVGTLQEGVVGPLKQINGLLAGLRTGFDVLRNRGRKTHVHEDEDMFV